MSNLLRLLGLAAAVAMLALATQNVRAMNDRWPSLYDPAATDAQLAERRAQAGRCLARWCRDYARSFCPRPGGWDTGRRPRS